MHDHAKSYVYAWLTLLALTGTSFGIDHLHLGALGTALALVIAALKASLVLMIFMHLGREPFPVRFVAFLNVAWILLLCAGIAFDVGSG